MLFFKSIETPIGTFLLSTELEISSIYLNKAKDVDRFYLKPYSQLLVKPCLLIKESNIFGK